MNFKILALILLISVSLTPKFLSAQERAYGTLTDDCHPAKKALAESAESTSADWTAIKGKLKSFNSIFDNYSLNDDGTVTIFNPYQNFSITNFYSSRRKAKIEMLLFSSTSDLNLVCQKFFKGSRAASQNGRIKTTSDIEEFYYFISYVHIGNTGKEKLISTSTGKHIQRIDCKIPNLTPAFSKRYKKITFHDDDTFTIIEPRFKYHRNKLRFSSEMNPNLICGSFGPFIYAGKMTTHKSSLWGSKTVNLNQEKEISSLQDDKSTPAVKEILCKLR